MHSFSQNVYIQYYLLGVLCFIVGVLISIIDLVWPHTFSTILEVYYGTPYDRHVILEESSDVRYRKRNSKGLEDPPGLGSRILRRLSSKTREPSNSIIGRHNVVNRTSGIENTAFQNEAPKSPWRYPFRRAHYQTPHAMSIQRTLSQDSGSSITSAAVNISPMHKQALSRMLP